jgi:hypothetical protein
MTNTWRISKSDRHLQSFKIESGKSRPTKTGKKRSLKSGIGQLSSKKLPPKTRKPPFRATK